MKTTRLALCLAFVLTGAGAFAQDYAFKVLANKGSNEVKSGEAWSALRTGTSLKPEDELKLVDNAYIGLVHSSGKPVELKQAGNYKVSELSAKVNGGTSVLHKYTDFILSSNSPEAKKNRLSATGAVHRATETSSINLLLPENQHSGIYNRTAYISWDGEKVPGPYIVKLRNMFDDELGTFETPEASFILNLEDPKYAQENAILVEVCSKADQSLTSKQHIIKKLPPIEQEKIKQSLQSIMGEVNEKTALNSFIKAAFYEEHNLYIDAIAAYEEAIQLAPDVPSYREAFEEFQLRHSLKK